MVLHLYPLPKGNNSSKDAEPGRIFRLDLKRIIVKGK